MAEPIQLTGRIREALQAKKDAGSGLHAIARDTGIPYSCLFEFLKGGGMRSDNLDLLVRYLGLWNQDRGQWTG